MLDENSMKRFFLEAGRMGINTVFIQGTGEPMLNKALPDAIMKGGESGLKMSLTTNGSAFNRSAIEKILHHMLFVKFSVLDNNKARYGKTHACSESQFDLVTRNISNACDYKQKNKLSVALWGSIYVDEHNFYDIPDIVYFCKEMGLDFVSISAATFTDITPSGRPNTAVEDRFSESEVNEMKERVLSYCDNDFDVHLQFPINTFFPDSGWREGYCESVKLITMISGDGNVYPCWRFWGEKEFSYGNINKNTFQEIWNSQRRKEINKYLLTTPPRGDECDVCKHRTANRDLDVLVNNKNPWVNIL